MEIKDLLIGKTVTAILLERHEQRWIRFCTTEGELDFFCEGDCCSESWIGDLIGVDNLLGTPIVEIVEKEMDDYDTDDGRGRQEYDEAYGFTFTTAKGHFDLVFRCSSNGYYGGWMYNKTEGAPLCEWMDITSDYPA